MQLVLILLVIAGGMGLSVEAGLLGPRGKVGDLWATFSIFGVGAALTFLLMLFSARATARRFRAARLAAPRRGAGSDLRRHTDARHADYRHRADDDWHSGRSGF